MLQDQDLRVGLVARRNQDQRSYKILMNAAGDSHDYAIVPNKLKGIAKRLQSWLQLRTVPDYIIGFAPGGIPIAVALSFELELPTVIAYKCRLGLPNEVSWSEPHCFNSLFYFYGDTAGKSLVLVDDEVDSGNTLCNAVTSLRDSGALIVDVGCVVETLHNRVSRGRARLNELGLDLKSVYRFEVAGKY